MPTLGVFSVLTTWSVPVWLCRQDHASVHCIYRRGALRCPFCEYRQCESPGVWNGCVCSSHAFRFVQRLNNIHINFGTSLYLKSRQSRASILQYYVVMKKKVCFSTYNELFVLDCEKVIYLEADDHYTHVYYLTGAHFMVPFGLSDVMDVIDKVFSDDPFLVRLGRKYVVNLRAVFHVNTVKQVLMLSDSHGNNHSLHLPKATLRQLIDIMGEKIAH